MQKLKSNLIGYCKAIFTESNQKIFTSFDILGIVLFFYPKLGEWLVEENLTRMVGGLIFFISFIWANFRVYQNLVVEGAEIHLKIAKQHFNASSGSRNPFRKFISSSYGFDKQGLPNFASLYADIDITNVGFEEGMLVWELDEGKAQFPDFFNTKLANWEFNPSTYIPARKMGLYAHLFYDILFTEQDPLTFAKGLKNLIKSKMHYKIIIRYWTEKVDGNTGKQKLIISGNFIDFYHEILEYWENYGFKDLVEIAK